MTTATTDRSLEERLDRLSEQVERLVEETRRESERRERWAELAHDLTPVARQALDSVGRGLEELPYGLDLEELGRLARTSLGALPVLEGILAQLESLAQLVEEGGRLGKPAFELLVARLGELEERGYFDFARSGLGVVDRVVTSFTEEDVEALGDNIVLILETVKQMTQPEVMQMLRRTLHTVRVPEEAAPPPSLFSLLREMRDPQVRRGLARVLEMLRSVSEDDTMPGTR